MRVLNFGSLNIDYVYQVDHFVQPGETEAASSHQIFAGGKGLNQSLAMARAGLDVTHAGMIGPEGDFLVLTLAESGVKTDRIGRVSMSTGHAIIQVDRAGRNCILIFGGANREIDAAMIDAALSGFGDGDLLVLQNEIAGIGGIMQKAHQRGMKIVFNPAPFTAEIAAYPLHLVDIFVVNEVEAAALAASNVSASQRSEASLAQLAPVPSGASTALSADLRTVIKTLANSFPSALLIVTLGEQGALAVQNGKEIFQPAFKVNAVDTTAAGDTFLGYFIAGLSENRGLKASLELAARASALCVSRKGASDSVPFRKELL